MSKRWRNAHVVSATMYKEQLLTSRKVSDGSMMLSTHLNIRSMSFLWYPSSRAMGTTAFDWPGNISFGVKTLGVHTLPMSIWELWRSCLSSKRYSDVFVVQRSVRPPIWYLVVGITAEMFVKLKWLLGYSENTTRDRRMTLPW